ncbi:L-ascorbate 6-phosphate lactonase [Bifidobacterium sp. ESL0775]|uniref:L-ascorbate 6-phosphate lactonase n=1 Tax=Bifidobacterium sp. ESL0775 TaxID=2983230 RepID=UPI0023F8E6A4|nr:L-ascorbate 6-phosphate lactonase [Bifidobacterium sp. ESL0775]WEV68761.1 L-ascorbate 6-phosphate lactonase [Bifidobacterium sp. ESL0775]
MAARNVSEVTRETWMQEVFPEWGTWLNEEIDRTKVPQGKFAMWWLGNMGIWLKTDQQTNLVVDFWCGTGKKTHDKPEMSDRHQWSRLTGGRTIQPNLRTIPMVMDPFSVTALDALLVTHYHHDHIDMNVVAAILQNVKEPIPFIGPQYAVDQWVAWGVPQERCRVVRPGDVLHIKDITINVVESFDRTVLITDPVKPEDRPDDDKVPDMDKRAVNYVIETSAGTIYHGGDSHYSTYYAEHGKRFDIDVALLAYGENPISVQDKMTSVDVLRATEALGAKVLIPLHWDVWSNMLANPHEVETLWRMRRERFDYKFHPMCWMPGGKFVYPDDKGKLEYYHERGFEDRYTHPVNVPFTAFL